MAIAASPVRLLHHAPGIYNINYAESLLTRSGDIVFVLGGADNTLNGLFQVGTLLGGTGSLSGLSQLTIPQAGGGLPFTSVTPLQLSEGPGGKIAALFHVPEHGIGSGDLNNALMVQRLDGGTLTGPAVFVSRDTPVDRPTLYSSLVWLDNGDYAVFSVDETDISSRLNHVTMQRFSAEGIARGASVVVVADGPAGGLATLQTNPTMISTAKLASGRIALAWTESSPFGAPTFGQPEVMVQILRQNGEVAVAPVLIDGTSAQRAQVLALDDGGFVVAWQDYGVGNQGIFKAQMLSGSGRLIGEAFEISSTLSPQEGDLTLIALRTGGFAATWRDMTDQSLLARMFDDRGQATGADFQVLDSAGDFIGAKTGMVALDGKLMIWAHGLNGTVGSGFVLQAQEWRTTSSLGTRFKGDGSAETISGSSRDDVLLGGGGRDTLNGGSGQDELRGGSGRDRLQGGDGRDLIEGGASADRLTGNGGADTFVYASSADGGDVITDFNGAEGDRLAFYRAGFNNAAGILSGSTLNTGHAGLFFETSTGLLTFDPDGNGAADRVLVADLRGVIALAYDDYVFL